MSDSSAEKSATETGNPTKANGSVGGDADKSAGEGDSSLAAYRDWQDELREYGETKQAMSLLIRLLSPMGRMDTWTVGFNAEPEHMHTVAYPDVPTRPLRLIIGTMSVSPIED